MSGDIKEKCSTLLTEIAKGDERSLELLYSLTSARLFSVALGITKNRHTAEDVLQETFLKVVKYAGLFKRKGNGYGWICTILKNTALTHIKKQRVDYDIDEFHNLCDLNVSPDKTDSRLEVEEALKTLEADEKKLIWLKYFCDMTVREIGKELSLPKSTIAYKINAAEKKLKDFFSI